MTTPLKGKNPGYAMYTQSSNRKAITKEEVAEYCVERTVSVSESLRTYSLLLKDMATSPSVLSLERKSEMLQLLEGMKETMVHMSDRLKMCI